MFHSQLLKPVVQSLTLTLWLQPAGTIRLRRWQFFVPLVFTMFLIVVILRLRLALFRQTLQHPLEDRIDGLLIGSISVPNQDQMRIEANGN